MFKKLLVFLASFAALSIVTAWAATSRDVGSYLLSEKGPSIFIVTPPSRDNTGCTAFSVRAPSKRIYTLTNAHCTELAEDGKLMARYNDGRSALLNVLKVSDSTDLAVLDGAPDVEALELASEVNLFERINVVGHPSLVPLVYENGYIIARDITKILALDDMVCNDKKNFRETVPTPFGPMEFCITHIDSYHTNVIIWPGNSGSPVLNDDGEVVGVAFASNGTTHWGSMVPLDVVKSFLSIF